MKKHIGTCLVQQQLEFPALMVEPGQLQRRISLGVLQRGDQARRLALFAHAVFDHLPALLVKPGHAERRQLKVIGQKDVAMTGLLIDVGDAAQ